MKSKSIIRSIIHFFSLESELENQDSVYDEIKKGIIFKGFINDIRVSAE